MNEEKTIKEWLETLPDGYKERALKNMDKEDADIPIESLEDAIIEAFDWEGSPERDDFWIDVVVWAAGGGNLPPLPKEK